ncbi:MAG: ATP-dependent DNA helicase [Candidatus Saccharimonadales bacterium]
MNSFGEIYNALNDEQKAAVSAIEGPVLVLAGPGTGKTQLLSARVANILKLTDTLPQNILCLTFTEAAALNMRERLNDMIGESAYDVQINTYHGFASEVIKTYPDYFETIDLESGQDSRMERPIDALRQLEIIKHIVDELPFSDPLRGASHYIKKVAGVVSDFKQADMKPKQVLAVAELNLQAISDLSPKIQKLMAPHGRIPAKKDIAFKLFDEVLITINEHKSNLAQTASLALSDAIEQAKSDNSTKPLTAWKAKWLSKDSKDDWYFTDPVQANKLISLCGIYKKYQKALETSGQYDFNDMIIRTIDALKEKSDLRFNLQEKYQYILLDEFQDTNLAQFELVKQLADHPVHEGRPNIMAVGDDDQGIFAFQGAYIGNMIAFIDRFKDVKIINLVKNYRSHQDILETAHNVAEQIESRLHHNLIGISKDIEAAGTNLPKEAIISRREFASQAGEYAWIAQTISEHIESGVSPNTIAVLAPKHIILQNLVPFLNALGIPVTYEKREDIFDTAIVRSIILVCEFLQAASEQKMSDMDSLLPKVLSLDFWNIPTTDIWSINWDFYAKQFKSYEPWSKLALQMDSTKQATEFLLHLGNQTDKLQLEYVLDYITGAQAVTLDNGGTYTSPLKNYYFSESAQRLSPIGFYEAISHLSVIRSQLRNQQTQEDKQLTVKSFLSLHNAYKEAEQPLLNTHPIAQSDASVQLQTVYKAKGLEYDYVFLPGMNDDVWGSSSSRSNNSISLPMNLQHIRHDSSSEDTKRRILFVAMTRAKYGLYITSYAQKEDGTKTMPVKYLQETSDEDGRISAILPANKQRVVYTERSNKQSLKDIDIFWHSRHLEISPDLKSLVGERLNHYKMSPTHLNTFTNIVYAGPQSFLLNTLLRFPEAQSPDSIYGDALHKSLEWYQKQGNKTSAWPKTPEVLTYFKALMSESLIETVSKQNYIDRGVHALNIYMKANAEKLKTNAKSEVDLRSEGITMDGALLTGKIDRLEIDEQNKTVRIIDFKSGNPSTKWSSDVKYINYKQQLYFYILLMEKSQTYKNYKVESAALDFIEPLAEGTAAPQLKLEFNQQDYDDFKRLVVGVWERIQLLDLPDVSNYPKSAVGMKSFIKYLIG